MQFFKSALVLAIATMATAEKFVQLPRDNNIAILIYPHRTVTVYACAPTTVAIVPTGGAYPVTSGYATPTGSPVVPVVPVVGSTGVITVSNLSFFDHQLK